ncbi:MAG: sigma-70 family RNA polymerase sigma factor [Actinomycetota bacterium]
MTDLDSFDAFYRSRRDQVARSLALTLGDEELAFDAADEAMSRALERWAEIRDYANPEGWVYRTGLNWARSWLRRRRRGAVKDRLVATSDRTEDRPVDHDLLDALDRLPDKQRAVVVLRFYRDWTVEQTAEALDIAPGTVKSRLNRALARLHHELGAVEGASPSSRSSSRPPLGSPSEGSKP